MRPKCLSCEGPGGKQVTVMIERARYTDGWQIRVCEDCRQVFEAMLDAACVGRQFGFPVERTGRPRVSSDRT